MDELELLRLDGDLRKTARSWRAWRRALRTDAEAECPLEPMRSACSLETFQAVRELPEGEPLKVPLERWIYRLTEQRVNARAIAIVRHAYASAEHAVQEPERTRATLRDAVLRALAEPSRRSAWLEGAVEAGADATSMAAALWERRLEVANRMGFDTPDGIELPASAIYAHAERWLERSQDWHDELVPAALDGLFDAALGRGAESGWPGRLSVRTTAELVDDGELFRGLRLDLGEVPAALGAASFVRTLARVGAAFVDAAAPAHQPFVIAHDPYGLRRRSHGALFGLLPGNAEFSRQRLGLGRGSVADHRRAIWRLVLVESRALALRVVFRRLALGGARSYVTGFEELVGRHFHAGLAGSRSAGVLWRLHDDDAQRLAGLLVASARTNQLVEAHDEDWFRNPRAIEQLRSEAELSPTVCVDESELAAGADELARSLAAGLA
jgi:hypothetical protein